jgi:hypothetical protein
MSKGLTSRQVRRAPGLQPHANTEVHMPHVAIQAAQESAAPESVASDGKAIRSYPLLTYLAVVAGFAASFALLGFLI